MKRGGPSGCKRLLEYAVGSLGFKFFSPQQLSRQSIGHRVLELVFVEAFKSFRCLRFAPPLDRVSVDLSAIGPGAKGRLPRHTRNIQRQLNVCTRLSNSPSLLLSLLLLVRAFRKR